jgi:hypothetical protein
MLLFVAATADRGRFAQIRPQGVDWCVETAIARLRVALFRLPGRSPHCWSSPDPIRANHEAVVACHFVDITDRIYGFRAEIGRQETQ